MTSITLPNSSLTSSSASPRLYKDSVGIGGANHHAVVDVVLRVTLFASSFIAIVAMTTFKQTKMIRVEVGMKVPVTEKFNDSPAFIYYVAALSVSCLYSIITGVLSVIAGMKPKGSSRELLLLFAVLDALLLGIMASATGAAGAIAYDRLVGDTHKRRSNICNNYSSFCGHIAGSVLLSLLPSVAVLLLVWLSVFLISKKMARP